MDKFSFIALWDVYNGLLTETQQDITDLYFNKDLTATEIAAEKGITRQAVSLCLKGSRKQLEEYEDKLHFLERLSEICLEESFKITDAVKWAEKFKYEHPELKGETEELCGILNKDYSFEVRAELEKPEKKELLYKDYTKEVFGRKKDGED